MAEGRHGTKALERKGLEWFVVGSSKEVVGEAFALADGKLCCGWGNSFCNGGRDGGTVTKGPKIGSAIHS